MLIQLFYHSNCEHLAAYFHIFTFVSLSWYNRAPSLSQENKAGSVGCTALLLLRDTRVLIFQLSALVKSAGQFFSKMTVIFLYHHPSAFQTVSSAGSTSSHPKPSAPPPVFQRLDILNSLASITCLDSIQRNICSCCCFVSWKYLSSYRPRIRYPSSPRTPCDQIVFHRLTHKSVCVLVLDRVPLAEWRRYEARSQAGPKSQMQAKKPTGP